MCIVLLQIFFHYSELAEAAESDLALGTSVEFVIQNRQVNGNECTVYMYM